MGWFSKKEESKTLLPELPENNSLTFPSQSENRDFNNFQYAAEIKENNYPLNNDFQTGMTANDNFENAQQSHFDVSSNEQTYRRPGPVLSHSSLSSASFESMPSANTKSPFSKDLESPKYKTKEEATVFVRLDKFQATKESLDNIKEKIDEIEKTLSKIKEVRDKEEKEIEEWEREIRIIKTRLEAIDSNLFDRLS